MATPQEKQRRRLLKNQILRLIWLCDDYYQSIADNTQEQNQIPPVLQELTKENFKLLGVDQYDYPTDRVDLFKILTDLLQEYKNTGFSENEKKSKTSYLDFLDLETYLNNLKKTLETTPLKKVNLKTDWQNQIKTRTDKAAERIAYYQGRVSDLNRSTFEKAAIYLSIFDDRNSDFSNIKTLRDEIITLKQEKKTLENNNATQQELAQKEQVIVDKERQYNQTLDLLAKEQLEVVTGRKYVETPNLPSALTKEDTDRKNQQNLELAATRLAIISKAEDKPMAAVIDKEKTNSKGKPYTLFSIKEFTTESRLTEKSLTSERMYSLLTSDPSDKKFQDPNSKCIDRNGIEYTADDLIDKENGVCFADQLKQAGLHVEIIEFQRKKYLRFKKIEVIPEDPANNIKKQVNFLDITSDLPDYETLRAKIKDLLNRLGANQYVPVENYQKYISNEDLEKARLAMDEALAEYARVESIQKNFEKEFKEIKDARELSTPNDDALVGKLDGIRALNLQFEIDKLVQARDKLSALQSIYRPQDINGPQYAQTFDDINKLIAGVEKLQGEFDGNIVKELQDVRRIEFALNKIRAELEFKNRFVPRELSSGTILSCCLQLDALKEVYEKINAVSQTMKDRPNDVNQKVRADALERISGIYKTELSYYAEKLEAKVPELISSTAVDEIASELAKKSPVNNADPLKFRIEALHKQQATLVSWNSHVSEFNELVPADLLPENEVDVERINLQGSELENRIEEIEKEIAEAKYQLSLNQYTEQFTLLKIEAVKLMNVDLREPVAYDKLSGAIFRLKKLQNEMNEKSELRSDAVSDQLKQAKDELTQQINDEILKHSGEILNVHEMAMNDGSLSLNERIKQAQIYDRINVELNPNLPVVDSKEPLKKVREEAAARLIVIYNSQLAERNNRSSTVDKRTLTVLNALEAKQNAEPNANLLRNGQVNKTVLENILGGLTEYELYAVMDLYRADINQRDNRDHYRDNYILSAGYSAGRSERFKAVSKLRSTVETDLAADFSALHESLEKSPLTSRLWYQSEIESRIHTASEKTSQDEALKVHNTIAAKLSTEPSLNKAVNLTANTALTKLFGDSYAKSLDFRARLDLVVNREVELIQKDINTVKTTIDKLLPPDFDSQAIQPGQVSFMIDGHEIEWGTDLSLVFVSLVKRRFELSDLLQELSKNPELLANDPQLESEIVSEMVKTTTAIKNIVDGLKAINIKPMDLDKPYQEAYEESLAKVKRLEDNIKKLDSEFADRKNPVKYIKDFENKLKSASDEILNDRKLALERLNDEFKSASGDEHRNPIKFGLSQFKLENLFKEWNPRDLETLVTHYSSMIDDDLIYPSKEPAKSAPDDHILNHIVTLASEVVLFKKDKNEAVTFDAVNQMLTTMLAMKLCQELWYSAGMKPNQGRDLKPHVTAAIDIISMLPESVRQEMIQRCADDLGKSTNKNSVISVLCKFIGKVPGMTDIPNLDELKNVHPVLDKIDMLQIMNLKVTEDSNQHVVLAELSKILPTPIDDKLREDLFKYIKGVRAFKQHALQRIYGKETFHDASEQHSVLAELRDNGNDFLVGLFNEWKINVADYEVKDAPELKLRAADNPVFTVKTLSPQGGVNAEVITFKQVLGVDSNSQLETELEEYFTRNIDAYGVKNALSAVDSEKNALARINKRFNRQQYAAQESKIYDKILDLRIKIAAHEMEHPGLSHKLSHAKSLLSNILKDKGYEPLPYEAYQDNIAGVLNVIYDMVYKTDYSSVTIVGYDNVIDSNVSNNIARSIRYQSLDTLNVEVANKAGVSLNLKALIAEPTYLHNTLHAIKHLLAAGKLPLDLSDKNVDRAVSILAEVAIKNMDLVKNKGKSLGLDVDTLAKNLVFPNSGLTQEGARSIIEARILEKLDITEDVYLATRKEFDVTDLASVNKYMEDWSERYNEGAENLPSNTLKDLLPYYVGHLNQLAIRKAHSPFEKDLCDKYMAEIIAKIKKEVGAFIEKTNYLAQADMKATGNKELPILAGQIIFYQQTIPDMNALIQLAKPEIDQALKSLTDRRVELEQKLVDYTDIANSLGQVKDTVENLWKDKFAKILSGFPMLDKNYVETELKDLFEKYWTQFFNLDLPTNEPQDINKQLRAFINEPSFIWLDMSDKKKIESLLNKVDEHREFIAKYVNPIAERMQLCKKRLEDLKDQKYTIDQYPLIQSRMSHLVEVINSLVTQANELTKSNPNVKFLNFVADELASLKTTVETYSEEIETAKNDILQRKRPITKYSVYTSPYNERVDNLVTLFVNAYNFADSKNSEALKQIFTKYASEFILKEDTLKKLSNKVDAIRTQIQNRANSRDFLWINDQDKQEFFRLIELANQPVVAPAPASAPEPATASASSETEMKDKIAQIVALIGLDSTKDKPLIEYLEYCICCPGYDKSYGNYGRIKGLNDRELLDYLLTLLDARDLGKDVRQLPDWKNNLMLKGWQLADIKYLISFQNGHKQMSAQELDNAVTAKINVLCDAYLPLQQYVKAKLEKPKATAKVFAVLSPEAAAAAEQQQQNAAQPTPSRPRAGSTSSVATDATLPKYLSYVLGLDNGTQPPVTELTPAQVKLIEDYLENGDPSIIKLVKDSQTAYNSRWSTLKMFETADQLYADAKAMYAVYEAVVIKNLDPTHANKFDIELTGRLFDRAKSLLKRAAEKDPSNAPKYAGFKPSNEFYNARMKALESNIKMLGDFIAQNFINETGIFFRVNGSMQNIGGYEKLCFSRVTTMDDFKSVDNSNSLVHVPYDLGGLLKRLGSVLIKSVFEQKPDFKRRLMNAVKENKVDIAIIYFESSFTDTEKNAYDAMLDFMAKLVIANAQNHNNHATIDSVAKMLGANIADSIEEGVSTDSAKILATTTAIATSLIERRVKVLLPVVAPQFTFKDFQDNNKVVIAAAPAPDVKPPAKPPKPSSNTSVQAASSTTTQVNANQNIGGTNVQATEQAQPQGQSPASTGLPPYTPDIPEPNKFAVTPNAPQTPNSSNANSATSSTGQGSAAPAVTEEARRSLAKDLVKLCFPNDPNSPQIGNPEGVIFNLLSQKGVYETYIDILTDLGPNVVGIVNGEWVAFQNNNNLDNDLSPLRNKLKDDINRPVIKSQVLGANPSTSTTKATVVETSDATPANTPLPSYTPEYPKGVPDQTPTSASTDNTSPEPESGFTWLKRKFGMGSSGSSSSSNTPGGNKPGGGRPPSHK